MKMFFLFLFFSLCLSPFAFVSADPSIEILLNNSSGAGTGSVEKGATSSGLQSGRYQAKEPNASDQPVFKIKEKKKSKGKKPASESAPIKVDIPAAIEEPEVSVKPTPELMDQVRDIFKGGAGHTGELYREQIHPDDIRNNRVELEVGTGTIYNNSTANLAYRNYYSFAPFMRAQAHLWMTPLVGISGSYLATFSETLPTTNSSGNSVSVKSDWSELSIDLRKFYGMSRRSNSLNYGLFYNQYKMSVGASELTRPGLLSQGLGLYLNVRIPTAPSYAWTFGGDVAPSIIHGESQTGLNLHSGATNASSRIGFFLGGEMKLSRENQLVWSLGVKIEKNQFSGSSNLADPYTGQTPAGVTVTNTWTYFNLGYRWGQ